MSLRQEKTMLLKAILTTAILGSSAVAMAQTYEPSPYRHDDTYGRVEVRRGVGRRQPVIATNVRLAADRQASFLRIDPRFRVSRVRLELQSGRSYVESVFVRHADGRQEVVPVRQMISPRTPRLVIDLPGRDIAAIAINTTQIRQARGGGYRHMRPATVRVVGVRW
jgi:hypothetical protein